LTRWIGAIAAIIAASAAQTLSAATNAEGAAVRGGCPYDFRSDMPRGEFCVYRGRVFAPDGALCSADAVMIWGTHRMRARRAAEEARDVFVGFVDDPSLVLHAVATRRTVGLLTGYSLNGDSAQTPVGGFTTLGRQMSGQDAMTLRLRPPVALEIDDAPCDFSSYRGVFIGVMRGTTAAGSPNRPN
jgi:hypothetical protein